MSLHLSDTAVKTPTALPLQEAFPAQEHAGNAYPSAAVGIVSLHSACPAWLLSEICQLTLWL